MRHQSYAYGLNHWLEDRDLQVILSHYWPSWKEYAPELESFGALAGTDVYEAIYHIDHDAPPVFVMHDLDGRRVDRVRLSPVETRLLKEIAPMNRVPYEGGGWHHHYALGYLLADPGLYCVITITGQTAYAIHKYAPAHAEWKEKLLAGEMFGATWMTENQGGSDLGANTTVARPDGEVWRLTGDKYFASGAGLTDVAIVTARPEGAPAGPKGLALFLVPRLNRAGELNYRVRRLKDKSATRAVPSGEVELENSEAYLVGRAEQGIYYTLENLTVSRLANAVAGMGIAKKAHLEVMERVRRRHSFGRALQDHPLVRRDLVDMAVRLVGGTVLGFHAVEAFQRAWHERPPYSPAYHYARFLSHLAKNRTADHAAEITRLAMELFGGLGFLEEYAVARWHREALITPIWEGPSNIQALDLLETVQKKNAHEGFLAEFIPILEKVGTVEAGWARETIEKVFTDAAGLNPEELQWYAKHWVVQMADAAQVALLYRLAETGGERYSRLATLYAHRFLRGEEYPAWALQEPQVWGGAAQYEEARRS
ncbi:acyl-CoA dehydrogenase family protein [Kyrpidia tusciae]|uniref:Acyl-CoA dehydrogenase domain protein n=1 Tax=Kyrpidia tusciae (strain DSM 2912 / NBRC 15312 / T2) TaxID=562970 RepID=D5WXE7_KYRT2|nr:acyl-CoA dehydrogenase family protein [Kyrpidia tusciae]ADG05868.1 acyl-CoA dehydrogenase domain protein [Kyrpidia tusciae DSM 2912]